MAGIETRMRVCGVDELPDGEARRVEGPRPVAVFNVDGTYFALDDNCTHQDFPLSEGWIEGDVVECALHMARFCIRTGKALCLPADRSVVTHPIDVVGNDIYVTIKER